ncbi:MAG: ATP-binding protein [Myxococcota bacterium]|nr:ATP-binding protein [Myxococcota bacterium]
MGLSVCYSMVTSVGGDIIVDSTPGQGTCFTVNIPGK